MNTKAGRKGFTIVEILMALAIIAILAAIAFPTFTSAKRSGKQTVTIGRLQDIYKAMMLYGADYQVHEEFEGLADIPAMALMRSSVLFQYGIARPEGLHSAVYPREGYKRYASSFTFGWLGFPGEVEPVLEEHAKNRIRLKEEQGAYVIVQDLVHDTLEFWPSEKESDPLMQRRFEISLRVNGSVKKERKPGIRGTLMGF